MDNAGQSETKTYRATLEINAATLAEGLAMTLPCVSKDTTLPTLMGVAFHIREDGSVALVATDRYLLAEYVIQAEHVESIGTAPGTFAVPTLMATEWAKLAKRGAKAHPGGPVTLTVEGQTATLADYETSASDRLVDGQHVAQYARLIPEPGNGDDVPFYGVKPAYLTAIAKLASAAGKNLSIRFDFTGENSSALFRVHGVDNFRGVVMPVRVSDW